MSSFSETLRKSALFELQKISRRFGYDVVQVRRKVRSVSGFDYSVVHPRATYSPWLGDEAFTTLYARLEPFTMVDRYRCYELWALVDEAMKVGGAVLEVGARRGGSGCILAGRVKALGHAVPVYLCDTFEGVPKAGAQDASMTGGEYADATKQGVEELAASLGLSDVVVLQGIFPEESGDLVTDERIALCHIDVDVYQSAKDVVEWVWPRLPVGGLIVFDDYGFSGASGVTHYVNEIKGRADCVFVHNLNGHAILMKRS